MVRLPTRPLLLDVLEDKRRQLAAKQEITKSLLDLIPPPQAPPKPTEDEFLLTPSGGDVRPPKSERVPTPIPAVTPITERPPGPPGFLDKLKSGLESGVVEFFTGTALRRIPFVQKGTTAAAKGVAISLEELEDYVIDPIAGTAALSFAGVIPGKQGIEKVVERGRKEDSLLKQLTGQSVAEAFKETDYPWGVKGLLQQIAYTPLFAAKLPSLGKIKEARTLAKASRGLKTPPSDPLEVTALEAREQYLQAVGAKFSLKDPVNNEILNYLAVLSPEETRLASFTTNITTKFGADDAINMFKLTMMDEAWYKAADRVVNSTTQRAIIRPIHNFSEKHGIDWLAKLTDTPSSGALRSFIEYEAIQHSMSPYTARAAVTFQRFYDQAFREAPDAITSRSGQFLRRLESTAGLSESQRSIYKIHHMVEFPEDYALSPAQKSFLEKLGSYFDDQFRLEKAVGVEIDGVVERYLPNIWDIPKKELLSDGRLGLRLKRLIVGAERSFQKPREIANVEQALQIGLKPRNEIKKIADIVGVRGAQSARARADTMLKTRLSELPEHDQAVIKKFIEQPSVFENEFLKPVKGLVGTSRFLKLSLDFAVVNVQAIAKYTEILVNPKRALESIASGYWASVNPRYFRQWMYANADTLAEMARAGTRPAVSIFERPAGGFFIEKTPLGKLFNMLNDAQFGRALTVFKHDSYLLNKEMLSKGSLINTLLGQKKGLLEGDAMRASAAYVNDVYGGLEQAILMQSATSADIKRLLLLTPDFTRATANLFVNALTRNTGEAILARQFLLRVLALYAGVTEMITYTTTGTHANVLNPLENDWMIAKTSSGNFSPLGRFRVFFKTILQPQERLANTLRGRTSIPLAVGIDLSTNRQFDGKPVTAAKQPRRFLEQTTYVAKELGLPIPTVNLLEAIQQGRATPLNLIGDAFGLNVFVRTDQERRVLDAVADAVIQSGANADRVRKLVVDGVSPFKVKGDGGKELFTNAEKSRIIAAVSERLGLDEETVSRMGRLERVPTVETARFQTFFEQSRNITDDKFQRFQELDARVLRGEVSLVEAHGLIGLIRDEARGARRNLSQSFSDVVEDLETNPNRIKSKNEIQALYDALSEQLSDAEFPDGTPDHDIRQGILDNYEKLYGKEFVRNYFEQYSTDYPELVKAHDEAVFVVLEPYWSIPEKRLAGPLAELYREYQKATPFDREIMKVQRPEVGNVVKIVEQLRFLIRLQNPEIDQALIIWYGYSPAKR